MPRMDITEVPAAVSDALWRVIVKDGKNTYRYDLLDNGTARVFKSLDALTPTYEIKDGICSCPAALHSKLCKHIKTVQFLAAG